MSRIHELYNSAAKYKSSKQHAESRNAFEEIKPLLKQAVIDYLVNKGMFNPHVSIYELRFWWNKKEEELRCVFTVHNNLYAANSKVKFLNKMTIHLHDQYHKVMCKTDPMFTIELANELQKFVKQLFYGEKNEQN